MRKSNKNPTERREQAMNHSGDAAEQIVRMSLEGIEVAAKVTGSTAKEIAIMLIAALKSNGSALKPKGKARLASMLKSGKPLEIFSVREQDLKQFIQGAKQYGIVYCALRNTKGNPDGMCDIMVKADDAPKISRLVERFHFATVANTKAENEAGAGGGIAGTENPMRPDEAPTDYSMGAGQEAPDANDTEKLLDDLIGTGDGKAVHEAPGSEMPWPEKTVPEKAGPEKTGPEKTGPEKAGPTREGTERPFAAGPEANKPDPSAPISGSRKTQGETSLSKPSVKEEIRGIKASRHGKENGAADRSGRGMAEKPKAATPPNAHRQPQNRPKPKNIKGNR
jgi:hypothetical protein